MAPRQSKPRYARLAYSRNIPAETSAVMTKLVKDPSEPQKRSREAQSLNVSRDMFEKLSQQTAQNTFDADSVFQLLPDVELAEQILVGSILSPKDMSSVELGFTVEEGKYDPEVARNLLGVVEDHFRKDYKIDDRLDGMLEEILFTKGAHCLAVLPENQLDMIINGPGQLSMEGYQQAVRRIQQGRPLGLLGHPRDRRVSMESFSNTRREEATAIQGSRQGTQLPGITVSDNFDLLKTPEVSRQSRGAAIGRLLGRHQTSMESASKGLTPEQIDELYTRPRDQKPNAAQVLVNPELMTRPSVGHPVVMKLPVESVIPVFVPGQPEDHVGYFIMIDQNGRPVVKDERRDYYGELRGSFEQNQGDNSSDLVRRTREALGGVKADNKLEYDEIQKSYSKLIENDLVNRLMNGIYGEEFALGNTEDVMRIMLYRSLQQKQTQLLYVPAELMTYMAFNYNEWGIGESLLTKSKILSSMRSVLLFADTMAGVRNAVGRKRATINVDSSDPDPQKTVGDLTSMVMEQGARGFPVGSPDPAQTLDYLNKAAYDFSVNVDQEGYPQTKVEFDDYTSNNQGGNPELQGKLRRMQISGFGMNPELVDPEQSPDFATSVVNNNLIMTRRVIRWQKKFCRFLTRFVQQYVSHSSTLQAAMQEELKGMKTKLDADSKGKDNETVLDEFIQALQVSLPEPDTTRIDQQLQSFQQYTSLLDAALEAHVTSDLFPAEVLNRNPDIVNQTMTAIRAYFQRSWLERNNIMPELGQLGEVEGRSPVFNLFDVQDSMFKTLGKSIQKYIDGMEAQQEKWAKKYGEPETDEYGGGSDYGDTDYGDADTADDEFGGGDDLGGDDFGEEAESDTDEETDVVNDDSETDPEDEGEAEAEPDDEGEVDSEEDDKTS